LGEEKGGKNFNDNGIPRNYLRGGGGGGKRVSYSEWGKGVGFNNFRRPTAGSSYRWEEREGLLLYTTRGENTSTFTSF